MSKADDLERRAMELLTKVQGRLDALSPEFFEAGHSGDITYLIPFFPHPSDVRPSPFGNLILEFYKGVEQSLREIKDPFEKAFLFFATHYGFIPIGSPQGMLEKAIVDEKRGFELIGTLMFNRPDILREQRKRFRVDYNATQALAILNQAGAYVLSELNKRDYTEPYKSKVDDKTLVQNFKKLIDRVIEIGRLPWEREPENAPVRIIDAAGSPIELLKIISQNADRFVRRYATLHGYEMGDK
jgi:hypothetical protein